LSAFAEDFMRYWRLPTMLLVVSLLVAKAPAAERILNFHSEIQVLPDSSLQVRETIKVRSEGRAIRHGIFRDFPTAYTGRMGEHYIVGFEVLGALRDGVAEPSGEESLSNGVRIRIGSASTVLPPGEYTYQLTYRVTREIGFFADHDELYWNVTGNGWIFSIDQASAVVTLPQPVAADHLRLAGYTGLAGSRDHDLTITRLNDTQVEFSTTQTLRSREGLTIVVGFPKGIVAQPTASQQARDLLTENMVAAIGLAGLMIVLLYYSLTWMRVGRDPRRGTLVIRYDPPTGMSPAAISFLQHMGYNDRVFVSAVVDLAVKGYLAIEQEASVYRLRKLKSEDGRLSPEEINLMRGLFSSSNTLAVNALESATFQIAKATLTADLNLKENHALFQKHWGSIWPGILLSLAVFAAIVLTSGGSLPLAPRAFMSFWIAVWTIGTGAIIVQCIKGVRNRVRHTGVMIFSAIIFTAIEIGVLAAFTSAIGLLPVLLSASLAVINVVFVYLIRSFTPEGRRLMDEVEGFRQFLTAVDGDRLQREGAPAKTPALFERCLPYALALGVEQAWARQFEGVLAQAATAGATGGGYSPAWYSSNDWSGFNPTSFAGSFGGGFSSAISSASTPPGSSSGGGGGGSSGGGGGGGGGGGW
jgi:uncharacterized membrane protein YgcG